MPYNASFRAINRSSLCLAAIACFTILPGTVRAKPTTEPASSTQPAAGTDLAEIRKVIEQLGDDDPKIRERASRRVNNLDGSAQPLMEQALQSGDLDPESISRLKTALKYIRPRAAHAKLQAAQSAWESRTLHNAYEKFGKTGSAFDADASRAIDLFLKLGPDPSRGSPELRTATLAAFDAAIDKGCRDPLILCLRTCAVGEFPLQPSDKWANGNSVSFGQYPPAAKFIAAVLFLRLTHSNDVNARALPARLLPDVLKDHDIPWGEIDGLVNTATDLLHPGDTWGHQQQLVEAYKRALPDAPGPLMMEAKMLVNWAHDLQFSTQAHDNDVEASKLLERAAQLAPDDFRPPTMMLAVVDGLGGDQAQLEQWFTKAITLDPDNYNACERKLHYLSPGRHGSTDQVIEFGRWCVATQNWRASIPFIAIKGHELLASISADPVAYFEDPAVWRDIQDVYEGALVNATTPQALMSCRSGYAKWAAECGQWKTAHELFDLLGNRADIRPFVSVQTYRYYRRKAARLASEQSQTMPTTEPQPQ